MQTDAAEYKLARSEAAVFKRPRYPCLRLTLPLAGCVEDFHLQVTSVATTAKLVALTRNAPCLAHQKKAPNSGA